MSKIESGRIVLAEEEVNLAELVHGVVTMVQPHIHSKDLIFKTYVSNLTHEIVVSDMQRLQQLVLVSVQCGQIHAAPWQRIYGDQRNAFG